MEHPYLFIVKLGQILGFGGFAEEHPHVLYTWVVMIMLIGFGALFAKSLSMIPSKGQNFFEFVVGSIEDFMVDITGEEGRYLFPIIATIFLFIFVSNIIGLIPGFFPPTASLNTTGACALTVVVFTHFIGVKHHGLKYIKHFMGPVWWMSPLIFVIELIGHAARILSLSFRLFGNMMGHEIVLSILFGLAGFYLAPLPVMGLGIFVAFVQAFVFFLLSIIYFSAAMEHAH